MKTVTWRLLVGCVGVRARSPGIGLGGLSGRVVAREHEAAIASEVGAAVPEQLLPAEAPDERRETGQRVFGARDDYAALVDQGEQVAQWAAEFAFDAQARHVAGVDGGFGERKRNPDQRVEEVVQAVGACLNPAGVEDFLHVRHAPGRLGQAEAQALVTAGRRWQRRRVGQCIEFGATGAIAEALEQGPQWVERGMGQRCRGQDGA